MPDEKLGRKRVLHLADSRISLMPLCEETVETCTETQIIEGYNERSEVV